MAFLVEADSRGYDSGISVDQKRIENYTGAVQSVDTLSGGLVHSVYRINGDRDSAILKVRGERFTALPEIGINPDDIVFEYRALLLASGIEPDVFPHVIGFSEPRKYILMTDIIPSGKTLDKDLEEGNIDTAYIKDLGRIIARTHRKLQNFEGSWRGEADSAMFEQDVYYRLGYHQIKALDEVVDKVANGPKQFVLADLSPKNIGKTKEGGVAICDLDAFCVGNLEYALSFLPAQMMLHIKSTDFARESLAALFEGYTEELPDLDINSDHFKKLVLGGMLYRLKNSVIPYASWLNQDQKENIANIVIDLLNQDNVAWDDIVDNIFINEK